MTKIHTPLQTFLFDLYFKNDIKQVKDKDELASLRDWHEWLDAYHTRYIKNAKSETKETRQLDVR